VNGFNIYLITNLLDDTRYVGKTIRSLETRWGAHLGAAKRGSKYHLHRALRKYGAEHFVIEPLILLNEDLTDEAGLNAAEVKMIRLLRVNCELYNICDGGEGASGRIPSIEHRRHLSEANKGQGQGQPWSAAHRAAYTPGQVRKHRGRPLSIGHRRKLSGS